MSEEASSPLPAEDVRRLARLARLRVSEEELPETARRLGAVLGYIDRLRAMDLSGVEPMAHPVESRNALAPDEPGPTLAPDTVQRLAPRAHGPFISVPRVIGGSTGAGGSGEAG